MTSKLRIVPILFLIIWSCCFSFGQAPANDRCENASEITIPNSSLGVGEFISDTFSITDAKREVGEKCSPSITDFGNCHKTIWYTFEIASTRDVSIELRHTNDSKTKFYTGVTVFRSNTCDNNNTGTLVESFVPVLNFGTSGNSCLPKGKYYVQVSGRQSVNAEVFLKLNISLPDRYDFDSFKNPLIFSGFQSYDFLKECLSVEANEVPSGFDADYTKSVWIKIPIEAGLLKSKIFTGYYLDTIAYRVFAGQVNQDSVSSGHPYSYIPPRQSITLYDDECRLSNKDTVIVQLLLKSEAKRLTVVLENTRPHSENVDWISSLTPHRDTLTHSSYASRVYEQYLSCNSLFLVHDKKIKGAIIY